MVLRPIRRVIFVWKCSRVLPCWLDYMFSIIVLLRLEIKPINTTTRRAARNKKFIIELSEFVTKQLLSQTSRRYSAPDNLCCGCTYIILYLGTIDAGDRSDKYCTALLQTEEKANREYKIIECYGVFRGGLAGRRCG